MAGHSDFFPHEGDASLEHAFNFYFASNPIKRVAASFAGLKQLYRYYSHIRANLSYPWLIRKEFPRAQIMIGGGAFTAFADQLIEKLPEGTIGILGEGEDAILKVINGDSLEQERYIIREGKQTRKGQQGSPALLDALTVDLPISRRSSRNMARTWTSRSACKRNGAARTTARFASIRTLRASECGTVRRRWW